jgi:hypothetical protein
MSADRHVEPTAARRCIVAEEERLLGQVQARAALGDEDDAPRAPPPKTSTPT